MEDGENQACMNVELPLLSMYIFLIIFRIEVLSNYKGKMVAKKTQPRRTALTWAVIGATVLVFVAATILTLLLGSKTKR